LDEIDLICVRDRHFRFFIKVHTISDDIDPNRFAPQEERRDEGLSEPRVNAARHVF